MARNTYAAWAAAGFSEQDTSPTASSALMTKRIAALSPPGSVLFAMRESYQRVFA